LISDRVLCRIAGSQARRSIFSNGFTYSGHPAVCAAALTNIDIMVREGLMEHVRQVGPYFQKRLRQLSELPIVGDVRGMGLMGCVECSIPGIDFLSVDYEIGNRIDAHCQKLGLIVRPLVNMCVMSPPLIITRDQVDELVQILRLGIEHTMDDLRREGVWSG
jgi:putrescine aminotransferase